MPWLGLAAILVIVQITVRGPNRSILWSAVFDAGHVPLYGFISLAILRMLRPVAKRRGVSRIRPYLLAFLFTLATGIIAEFVQGLTGGDASARDAARDAAGAATFLLVVLAFDRKTIRDEILIRPTILLILAILPLTVAFASLAATSLAFLQRNAAFPRICGFESRWERRFVSTKDAEMVETPPPEGWRRPSSDRVARLLFRPGEYPGFAIDEPYPDWRGFEKLVIEVFSELPGPIELVLRIDDRNHNNRYDDRFNRVMVIAPGANHLEVPLQEVESAPRGRRMDMSRIWGLVLFADHPRAPFVLYVGYLRLE